MEALMPRKIFADNNLNNIIKVVQTYFCLKTVSEAIRLVIEISLYHHELCKNIPEYIDFINKIREDVGKIYNKKEIPISFRISDDLLAKAKTIYPTIDPKDKTGISFAISCCLIETYEHIQYVTNILPSLSNLEPLSDKESLFYRDGRKNGSLLKKLLKLVKKAMKKNKRNIFIEACAGTANLSLHLDTKFKKIILNDGEYDITNLLSVIKKDISILIILLLRLPINKQILKRFKDEIKEETNNLTSSNIVRATKYYYTMFFSGPRRKSSDIESIATKKAFLSNLLSLRKISMELKDAIITQEDVFDFLNNLLEKKKSLKKYIIYIDPPYIGTEKCYKLCQNVGFSHEELRDLVSLLIEKGAIVILSYRATVGESNRLENTDVQKQLDALYRDKGFFIQFQKVHNKQIEVILSNAQDDDSIPYNDKIATLIQKYVK